MKFNIKMLNINRKREKYLTFYLDIDSKAKKATENKSELQDMFIKEMKTRKKQGIKGKLAIEINAFTNQRNPPRIEKFVKNIIDIMHKKDLLVNPEDYIYLPFEDDKLIKYLRAKYIFIKGDSFVHINIKPFGSFISDIHFVKTEIGPNYDIHVDTNNNSWEKYKEFVNSKGKHIGLISGKAYESMRKINILDVQREICDSMSITPEMICLLYPKQNKYIHISADIYKDWATVLLDMPIIIHLPGIPLNEGEESNYKIKYKENIKNQMRQYLTSHEIFHTLQSPIIITTFYMPPKKKKKHYKDIDNIMLEYIMPAMNEVFNPPITMFGIGMEGRNCRENSESSFSAPRSLNGSAIGFEVIELPYHLSNSDTGFIKGGFRIDDVENSVMRYIDAEIDKYIKEKRYVG